MEIKRFAAQVNSKKYLFGFINHLTCNHVSLIKVFGFPVYKKCGKLKSILGFTYGDV